MHPSLLPSLRLFAAALLAVFALAAAPAAAQDGEVDMDVFYRELEPHGRWFTHDRYGEVWVPDVDDDWRPYTRGGWVHTDEHGWYWESQEPFGWIVYHYGRWFLDEDRGWVWVPGTEWGPAWVAWRYSEENVGWAPLPPEAEWDGNEIVHVDAFYDAPRFSPAWCFVPVALLTAPRIWTHVVPARRNTYYLGRTRFVPAYRTTSFGIYNGGFDRRRYERLTGRPIVTRRIITVDRPFRGLSPGGPAGAVQIYRPRVVGLPPPGSDRRAFDRDWRRGDDPRDGRDGNRPVWRRPDWQERDRRGPDGRDGDRRGGPGVGIRPPAGDSQPPAGRSPEWRDRRPPSDAGRAGPTTPPSGRGGGPGGEPQRERSALPPAGTPPRGEPPRDRTPAVATPPAGIPRGFRPPSSGGDGSPGRGPADGERSRPSPPPGSAGRTPPPVSVPTEAERARANPSPGSGPRSAPPPGGPAAAQGARGSGGPPGGSPAAGPPRKAPPKDGQRDAGGREAPAGPGGPGGRN